MVLDERSCITWIWSQKALISCAKHYPLMCLVVRTKQGNMIFGYGIDDWDMLLLDILINCFLSYLQNLMFLISIVMSVNFQRVTVCLFHQE